MGQELQGIGASRRDKPRLSLGARTFIEHNIRSKGKRRRRRGGSRGWGRPPRDNLRGSNVALLVNWCLDDCTGAGELRGKGSMNGSPNPLHGPYTQRDREARESSRLGMKVAITMSMAGLWSMVMDSDWRLKIHTSTELKPFFPPS